MKQFVLPALFAIVILAGCTRGSSNPAVPRTVSNDPSYTSLAGRWKLLSIDDYVANQFLVQGDVIKSASIYAHPEVEFNFDLKADTTFLNGFTLVNLRWGAFYFGRTQRSVSMYYYGGEKAGEFLWSDKVDKLMDLVRFYDINSTYLRFYTADKSKGLTFIRE